LFNHSNQIQFPSLRLPAHSNPKTSPKTSLTRSPADTDSHKRRRHRDPPADTTRVRGALHLHSDDIPDADTASSACSRGSCAAAAADAGEWGGDGEVRGGSGGVGDGATCCFDGVDLEWGG
jgi:hypothetical protein